MNTIRMTSRKIHSYGQKTYQVGDPFDAEEHHVKMLVATGRAKPQINAREVATQVKAAITDKPKHDGKEKK